jgi:hypothetical protein
MSSEDCKFSRRSFLTTTGGVAVGLGIGRLPGTAYAADALPPLPWTMYYPSQGLDPAAVRERGYCLYFREGGCGHASAQALIDTLGETLALENPEAPNPWPLLPRGIYKYAGAGVVSWGTICGVLNATIGVMDILGVHGQLGNALMDYYCNTELPTDALVGYLPPFSNVPVPLANLTSSVSRSPLCHNSMSIWAAAAGVPTSHPTVKDRDAKLVGDIVARAAQLMNDFILNKVAPPAWTPPVSYASCYSCHSDPAMTPSQTGRMDCTGCHDMPPAHGTWRTRGGSGGQKQLRKGR